MMAFVTMVVPWATDVSGALPTRVVRPCITPRAGLAGVVGTLPLESRPEGARTTKSVNVPPTSMPTLLPVMRETVAREHRDFEEWAKPPRASRSRWQQRRGA